MTPTTTATTNSEASFQRLARTKKTRQRRGKTTRVSRTTSRCLLAFVLMKSTLLRGAASTCIWPFPRKNPLKKIFDFDRFCARSKKKIKALSVLFFLTSAFFPFFFAVLSCRFLFPQRKIVTMQATLRSASLGTLDLAHSNERKVAATPRAS